MDDRERQRVRSEEQVRILGIAYVVSACVTGFFGLFALIYVFLGIMFRTMPMAGAGEQADPEMFRTMGAMFTALGLVAFVVIEAFALLKLFAGLNLLRRRRRMFCLVVSGISCLGIPYSTALGIAGFVVLTKEPVRELFEGEAVPRTAQGA